MVQFAVNRDFEQVMFRESGRVQGLGPFQGLPDFDVVFNEAV